MARKKSPSNTVEFIDAKGVRRWSAIDSPAYLASPAAATSTASEPDADTPPVES